MEHVSLSAELGEICYAIEGAHWIADSVALGAVPDPDQKQSAPVIISAILVTINSPPHYFCVGPFWLIVMSSTRW